MLGRPLFYLDRFLHDSCTQETKTNCLGNGMMEKGKIMKTWK